MDTNDDGYDAIGHKLTEAGVAFYVCPFCSVINVAADDVLKQHCGRCHRFGDGHDDEALDPAFLDAMHALVQLFGQELDEDGMERLAQILVNLVKVVQLVDAYEAAHGPMAAADTSQRSG